MERSLYSKVVWELEAVALSARLEDYSRYFLGGRCYSLHGSFQERSIDFAQGGVVVCLDVCCVRVSSGKQYGSGSTGQDGRRKKMKNE